MRVLLFLLILVQFPFLSVQGQGRIGIGDWQLHLSYAQGRTLAEAPDRYYAATNHGLFAFNTKDRNLETFTPQQGFSGVDITTMRYHSPSNQLFIAYRTGLIDILKDGNEIRTLTNIANKDVVGNKAVKRITFAKGKAYFSTDLGLITYNIEEKRFGSTFFGPLAPQWQVTGFARLNNRFYAATEEGLLTAPVTGRNLQDVNAWQTERPETGGELTSYQNRLYFRADSQILVYQSNQWEPLGLKVSGNVGFNVDNEKLFISSSNGKTLVVKPNGSIDSLKPSFTNRLFEDNTGNYWFNTKSFPLLKQEGPDLRFFKPGGPASKDAWSVTAADQKLYATGGGYGDNFFPTFSFAGLYIRSSDGKWQNLNVSTSDSFEKYSLRDFVDVAVDPNRDRFFAASFNDGLIAYESGAFSRIFTPANSKLSMVSGDFQQVRVAGLAFDRSGNLWMTNHSTNNPLVCYTADGEWYEYTLGGATRALDLVIDDFGRKWIRIQDQGLVVYDNNGTLANKRDDRLRRLNDRPGNGGLPSNDALSLASDKNGNIWVGTTDGVGVFFNTRDLFESSVNAQDVFVEQGEESGLLLRGESVTAIAVDGGNNKWFGTPNGALYTTESGDAVINRFDQENSPLLSSNILDIAIARESGRVYFATTGGLASYRGRATEGQSSNKNVYAFPNPVKPAYEGPIAIKGLVTNALVKITDASGNLVRALRANGSQAVWDGRNRNGTPVNSGVYYVYATDEQGTKTKVTKILVMN